MAKYLANYLDDTEFFDLQDNPLPMCDGDECYENPIVGELKKSISSAKSVLFASPIYNFDFTTWMCNCLGLFFDLSCTSYVKSSHC